MANKNVLLGMLVMVLVFGTLLVGCDNGTTGGQEGSSSGNGGDDDPVKGTWTGIYGSDNVKMVVENGSFKEYVDTHGVDDLEEDYRGTYTYSGNTVTITITEVRESSGWVSYENASDNKPPAESFTGTISGNKMIFTGSMTLTKSDDDPVKGTWTGMFNNDNVKLVAENGSFKEYIDGHGVDDIGEDYRGTYTYSGNSVTLKVTEVRESSGWVSYENASDNKPPAESFTGTISGNKMIFTGLMTLTKQ